MSSIYKCDSQFKNARTSIHGIPRHYLMEALEDDPRFILTKFNAPRCFKGFRSFQNDNSAERQGIIMRTMRKGTSSTNGLLVDQTNVSKDIFYTYGTQNHIILDKESEHMKGIQRECPPQMISKGVGILTKKLHAHGKPLDYPPRKGPKGKRDMPLGIEKEHFINANEDKVSGDEVFYSTEGGTSSEHSPRRVLKDDDISNENSNVGNKPLKGFKLGNNYGDGWGIGYQKLCDKGIHHRVRETLELFRQTFRKFQQENKDKPRIERGCGYTTASNVLKKNGKWLNTDKCLGSISGIDIGDEFQSKVELRIVGLHHRRFCGIDYLIQDGVRLATSVVATGRYANKMEGSDVLVYIGEGGNPRVQSKRPLKDQKLERGNLALKNSIEHKTPVRVIRHKESHQQNVAKLVYVYEGLYLVETYRKYRGKSGKLVFEFLLRKILGQQKFERVTSVSKKTFNENERVLPIQENLELDIEKSPFLSSESTTSSGCGCVDGCFECENCSCKIKNDGKMPYDYDGCLARKMPYIYECGPSCKCSLSCPNRVSQRGTRAKLELFKNEFSRYGVRSKSHISKGSFICKYVPRKGFLGKEKSKETNDVTIDVSEYPNVGRFIGNSNSPNLYGQEIIIGNEDKSHMMLFAMRNIPPLEELTIGQKNQILNT